MGSGILLKRIRNEENIVLFIANRLDAHCYLLCVHRRVISADLPRRLAITQSNVGWPWWSGENMDAAPGPGLAEIVEALRMKLGNDWATRLCTHFMHGSSWGSQAWLADSSVFIQCRIIRYFIDAESITFKKNQKWANNKMHRETRKSTC